MTCISIASLCATPAAAGPRVLDALDLRVETGEIYGLVGPSGCGKSTLLRVLAGLNRHWTGSVELLNQRLIPGRPFTGALRRAVQMVFQDPYASLHPLHTVERTLLEPLQVNRVADPNRRLRAALEDVQLPPDIGRRHPHELSGGQRQRVAIARALLLKPALLLLDEPTSALDLSVQAEILNVLNRVRVEHGMTLMLVSHDRDVIGHLCDRAAVLRGGRIERVLTRREML